MKTEFTPGPWVAWNPLPNYIENGYDSSVFAGNGNLVASIKGTNTSKNTVEQVEANATLVAAAPDLLEALLFINQEWGNFLAKTNIRTSFYSARELRFMNEMELKMAAAIAKATASKDHTQPNNQKSSAI